MADFILRAFAILFALTALSLTALAADEAKRIALVIGIARYDALTPLGNPGNDATAIARLLEANGIAVTLRRDLTHAELLSALADFEAEAQGADLAIVYYAGHGLHLAGRDVLLPKDAAQKCGDLAPAEAQKGTVGVDKVVDALRAARQRVVILDACRASTFPSCPPKRGAEGAGFRALGRIEAKGTLIATSTMPGGLADDGPANSNSPFASRLLRHLQERRNAYFHDVLIRVNEDMAQATGGATGDIYFAGGVPPKACLAVDECGRGAAPVDSTEEVQRLRGEIEALRELAKQQQEVAMRAEAPAPAPEDSAAAAPSATDHDGELPLMFRECPVCPTMRQMAIGHYTQGSDASEVGRLEDEGPQHAVEFNHAFAVGVTEVTFAEWDACVADKGCSYVPPDEGWGRGRRPVINVSWQDTQDYLQWLSKKTGKRYRLLTEAEWEFAARNDTTTPFSTGTTITTDQANFNGTVTYGGSRKGLYRKKTVEAGSLRPKGFLHDLHGNVWEWVEDCFERYSDDPSDGAAVTAANCDMRVMRGGAWNSPPAHLRSAMRGRTEPVRRDSSIGFRVARTLRLPSLDAE